MIRSDKKSWMVSMHGGHSGDYCDHAVDTLRDVLRAAVAAGYHTFGVSEHAPRSEERFLYENEIALGWTAAMTIEDFERYIADISGLADEFAEELAVVRGFEAEVVPSASYVERMNAFRNRVTEHGSLVFDFMVGSVHYVDECQIDGPPESWMLACESHGGPEGLAVAYYNTVADMVQELKPDIVGHFDLIKRNVVLAGVDPDLLKTPLAKRAVENALESVRANGGILDLNTAGWRKDLGEPYPAPWLVEEAMRMNIPFCFGDDSHGVSQVGFGIERARLYLLESGVKSITCVVRGGERMIHSLE